MVLVAVVCSRLFCSLAELSSPRRGLPGSRTTRWYDLSQTNHPRSTSLTRAGYLFPYPNHQTWEWTSDKPIRSVFPLWPVYGLPMTLLKWVWAQDEDDHVDPAVIYYTLRLVMLALSFVLEDWAVHELVRSPRHWQQAAILVASSYVTWTFQTHTFSNSVETLAVLWSLVVIERILREKVSSWP